METKILTKQEVEEVRGKMLAKSGLTCPKVAEKFKCTRQTVYNAIQGVSSSPLAAEIQAYCFARAGIENRGNE